MEHKRTDIQVLRAIAVLLVLVYHGGISLVPRGYLGVDIFFVISGFLVTRMIVDDLDAGRFSFLHFYARRAKRLLPAAYCTLSITALLAPYFLTFTEYRAFLKQLVGAVTFTANVVLLNQTGYFEGAAEFKPLLHVWSLSLEEQYYLLLPLLLVLVGKRRSLTVVALFCTSLIAYAVLIRQAPDRAFYLLPTRAWELLIGSLCTIRRPRAPATFTLPVALAAVIAVPVIPRGLLPLGLDALLVTGATALLLVGRFKPLEESKIAKLLVPIGDQSYSLYLVHWPLFAFAANAYLQSPPPQARYGLMVLALVLAYLQYRFVETPFRRMTFSTSRAVQAVALGSMIVLLPLPAHLATREAKAHVAQQYEDLRRINFGLGPECEYTKTDHYVERPMCLTSPNPQYAVWGDSFAMHLVPGIAASEIGSSLVQITRAVCAPLLGVALVIHQTYYDRTWAESCIRYNESVYEYLKQKKSIQVVILSSPYSFLSGGADILRNGVVQRPDRERLLIDFKATVEALRLIGKRVVVIGPPPGVGWDIGLCLERWETGAILLGRSDCHISVDEYHRNYAHQLAFLPEVAQVSDVSVLWPADVLCDQERCRTTMNGHFLYRDNGHFSVQGSLDFARAFQLAAKIKTYAR